MVGFLTANPADDGCEISLGMRPDLTGAGRGAAFMDACLSHLRSLELSHRMVLSVAAFNERGIRVYEGAGFRQTGTFLQDTNGGSHDFVAMVLDQDELG